MLYDVNLGIRDYFTYTDAMLNNSLFSYYLQRNGLNIYKGESTRDAICLDFDFGSRSYKDEMKRLTKMMNLADDESKVKIQSAIDKVKSNKDLYAEMKREQIREEFYQNGVNITYTTKNKDGSVKNQETVHYEMLYRTSAKAKLGQVIFINGSLYDLAYDWLTMGLGSKMPKDDAKIVEMSAYAPLTTSTIVGTMQIPVGDILILKDQDSFFKTMTNVVRAEEYEKKIGRKTVTSKKCVVVQEESEVKNTVWDGMGIIESSIMPSWTNGMALLRNHMFKMCGFRGHIQKFMVRWCYHNGYNYYTHKVQDMFGCWHYVKDIKVITTDNAIKWKKFSNLMGDTLTDAYHYWCSRIIDDGSLFGIVKTDHESKLGDTLQQMSYQMINTLPCTQKDIEELAKTSIDYVELLKADNREFEKFLRRNANEVNHYEMLADLYAQNHEFANCTWFRNEKKKVIFEYVYKLRTGKITINADNLTVCGNPYALLLHSVGENWENDPTFRHEDGSIQCYTTRFEDGEYLCAFRNPHNAPNNICYFHNVYSPEIEEYFPFSKNILAVNCIGTDIQDRANGMDFDSDFMFVTNNPICVKYADIAYRDFPTIVNALKESGITYQNTKLAYAQMDNKFSKSRLGIGWSSNLAQLAMTYYWTELQKENPDHGILHELHDNFIILSVLAQVIIDGCKREYEIDGMEEIDRIQRMPCMKRYKTITASNGETKDIKFDYPLFMKYTRTIQTTKGGKDLPFEIIEENKNKLKRRIDESLICPMNWLQECLDKIQNASNTNTIPTSDFFIKMQGKPNSRQVSKIMNLVADYDNFIKSTKISYAGDDDLCYQKIHEKSQDMLEKLESMKIGNIVTINRLIETALGISSGVGACKNAKYDPAKYTRKILNCLYKMNRDKFLINFKQ